MLSDVPFGDNHIFGDPLWYHTYKSPYFQESHANLRQEVRGFIEKEIMPFVDDWDEAYQIPREIYKKMGDRGYTLFACGMPYPTEYMKVPKILAGASLDTFHEYIVTDELSRTGSGGVTWGLVGGLGIGLPPVLRFGSQFLRDKVVGPCLRGDEVICLAVTEPTAGSDVAQLRCSAKKEGDVYIVNGQKKWITNGVFADYFTTAVRTGGPGMGGISLLLIEKSMKGVTTKPMKCSGVWCSGTTFISFDNVRVPCSHLIGEENKGFRYIMHNFNHERVMIATQSLRFARCCLEDSYVFSLKRKTFGKSLFEHPVIRWKLGEMARQVEASQSLLEFLVYQFCKMSHKEMDVKLGGLSALMKVQSTKTFEFCAREAQQIFGGLGYTRGGQAHKVERLAREVRGMAVPGGSEEILLDLAVRQSKKLSEVRQLMSAKL